MTCLKYTSSGFDIDSIYDNYEFERIRNAVCNYIPGCKGIEIIGSYEDGEIDHQSIPECNIEIIDTYEEDEIIDFIFNKYVMLKTYCD